VAASLLLAALTSAVQADRLILPTIPGTGVVDITKPGLRVQDGVIYETYPGPMGIINPMGTTYKREGGELVPHTSILGPQDFEKPSYKIEDDDRLTGDY
jgi:hypothetical protein